MRALITASFTDAALARLSRRLEVRHEDWRRTGRIYHDASEFARRINELQAEIVIIEADLLHEEVLERSPLRLIGCCRGDPVNVAIARATALGIPVLYTPARNADAVADLTLAYMLALARHIYPVNQLLKSGEMRFASTHEYLAVYDRFGGIELGGKVVGVVGFGAIGRRVVQRVRAFGSRVLVHDPFVAAQAIESAGAEPASLDEVVRSADFLTVHCPETPENQRLIDADRIRSMKRGAFFLNLARASLADENALYEALVSGRLGGAALDVFESEPVTPENRFVRLPQVLVSPHLGGATADVVRHQSEMMVEGIEAWLSGRLPAHIVNPEALRSS